MDKRLDKPFGYIRKTMRFRCWKRFTTIINAVYLTGYFGQSWNVYQTKQEKKIKSLKYIHSFIDPRPLFHSFSFFWFQRMLHCSKAHQPFFWWFYPFITIKGQTEIVDHVITSTTMFVSHHSNELRNELLL